MAAIYTYSKLKIECFANCGRPCMVIRPILYGTDLLRQLEASDPLLLLPKVIPWPELDEAFARQYTRG